MDFEYNSTMLRGLFIVITTIAIGAVAYAQSSTLAGDYVGMLGPYHVKLHLVAGPDGGLTGTAANSDTGMVGACEKIRAEGQTLSRAAPRIEMDEDIGEGHGLLRTALRVSPIARR